MIVLASTSATRHALLVNAGVSFTSLAPAVDEAALVGQNAHWSPGETAVQLAWAKALDVSRRSPEAMVIGADQVLEFENRAYSKPADIPAARSQLMALRNKTHHLISAVACARDGETVWNCVETAALSMRDFSDAFLDDYLARNGEATLKSVGGYQVEGLGIQLFQSISGDYTTILGLPLIPLLHFLRSAGELRQ